MSAVSCASARPVPSPTQPLRRGTVAVPGPRGSASREVLAPVDTTTPGAPLRDELPFGRPSGTRIARSSPVPPSGFLPLSTVSAYPTTCAVESPTPRGLIPCRSRPWSAPPELSLPGEPHPLSRAVASLRVRLRLSPAQYLQELRGRFHLNRASSLPLEPTTRLPAQQTRDA